MGIRRLLAVALGAAMIFGSLFAFTGTANALPAGQIRITNGSTITLAGITTTITGSTGSGASVPATGIPTGAWNGSWTATGSAPPCFSIGINVPTSNVTWTAPPDSATMSVTNAQITVNSTGCTNPPQGICVITLNGIRNGSTGSFAYSNSGDPIRSGNFTFNTTVGSCSIANGTNCFTSGLARQIATSFGVPAATPVGPGSFVGSTMTGVQAFLGVTVHY